MSCPPTEQLLELVSGKLDATRQLAIEEHIDVCEPCRVGVAAILRDGDRVEWMLGRYRIDDVLGAGGMGIVYRAWDPALSRQVAVKVVKPESDDGSWRERLAREARSLARLNHPNVCQVYDVGGDGAELWIAMELVAGVTSRAWLAGQPSRPEILAMLDGAGRGLAAAHAAGLVHRDVKPENVLVDRSGRAVVTDFGLALDVDRATRTSALAGTPAYMAPEQLDGAVADARSDQYAFAVMTHEALTGARPRPRNAAAPNLPAPLRAVLDRALADDPAARFPSIAAFLDALHAAEQPRPRARWPIALAGIAALGLAGAVALGRGGTSEVAARPTREAIAAAPSDAAIDARPAIAPRDTAVVALAGAPSDAAIDAAPALAAVTRDAGATVALPRLDAGAALLSGDPGAHIVAANQRAGAGDGAGCLAELAAYDRLVPGNDVTGSPRATCLMLAGRCEAGRTLMRDLEQTHAGGSLDERELDRRVDAATAFSCRSGELTDRDRLLRALYVLAQQQTKPSAAACRTAYGDATRTIPLVVPRDNRDATFDAFTTVKNTAPGCFARAGDCAGAWAVAKELDVATPRRTSTEATRRATFTWSAGLVCADRDQGTLTDAEQVFRAISELDHVNRLGKPTATYCTARVGSGRAALLRLGDVSGDPQQKQVHRTLAAAAVKCLLATADCAAAWQAYASIEGADAKAAAAFQRSFKCGAPIP